jgi:hypothetical protein
VSFSAPATISAALALPALISTTMGSRTGAATRREILPILRLAALGVDDQFILWKNGSSHLHRPVEQTARVVAQIEHQRRSPLAGAAG